MGYTKEVHRKQGEKFHGETLLLVDDNAMSLRVMQMLLEEQGLNVITALDGLTALQRFKESAEGSISVVLLDINMYGMDGFETARAIRKSGRMDAKTTKILAMSADMGTPHLEKAKAIGINGYVTKPIEYPRLFAALRHLIRGENKKKRAKEQLTKKQIFMGDLNPHFLFNVLNSIKSAVILQEENAYEHIDNLSLYLRHVFAFSGYGDKVAGSEAVSFLEVYFRLEQLRFEKIRFSKHIETLGFWIEPFLLIHLADFMIHESMLAKQGESTLHLLIQEEADKTKLVLSDNGNGCDAVTWLEAQSVNGMIGKNKRDHIGISIQGDNKKGRGITFTIVIP